MVGSASERAGWSNTRAPGGAASPAAKSLPGSASSPRPIRLLSALQPDLAFPQIEHQHLAPRLTVPGGPLGQDGLLLGPQPGVGGGAPPALQEAAHRFGNVRDRLAREIGGPQLRGAELGWTVLARDGRRLAGPLGKPVQILAGGVLLEADQHRLLLAHRLPYPVCPALGIELVGQKGEAYPAELDAPLLQGGQDQALALGGRPGILAAAGQVGAAEQQMQRRRGAPAPIAYSPDGRRVAAESARCRRRCPLAAPPTAREAAAAPRPAHLAAAPARR